MQNIKYFFVVDAGKENNIIWHDIHIALNQRQNEKKSAMYALVISSDGIWIIQWDVRNAYPDASNVNSMSIV